MYYVCPLADYAHKCLLNEKDFPYFLADFFFWRRGKATQVKRYHKCGLCLDNLTPTHTNLSFRLALPTSIASLVKFFPRHPFFLSSPDTGYSHSTISVPTQHWSCSKLFMCLVTCHPTRKHPLSGLAPYLQSNSLLRTYERLNNQIVNKSKLKGSLANILLLALQFELINHIQMWTRHRWSVLASSR